MKPTDCRFLHKRLYDKYLCIIENQLIQECFLLYTVKLIIVLFLLYFSAKSNKNQK